MGRGKESERSGSGINSSYPPQERYETLRKVSGPRGKDEIICGHVDAFEVCKWRC